MTTECAVLAAGCFWGIQDLVRRRERALRMTVQSLAREFGPQGIHFAHVIIDGVIDGDRARAAIPEVESRFADDGMLKPDHIAETYLALHRQHRTAWTHELDLRPWIERF